MRAWCWVGRGPGIAADWGPIVPQQSITPMPEKQMSYSADDYQYLSRPAMYI